MGISEQTFYRWKKVYGGLGVGELRRLKQLEDENRQLKQLVADLSLDKHILQDVLSKKLWRLDDAASSSRTSSRPGKPTDNAFVESFNGRLRDECLNTHWFLSLEDARAKIDAWRRDYNESRPHTSLGWLTPIE
jgi:hypothetical protein